eukprot:CAMPEP_0185185660 /NCGR_PEP_ID=MMETSP1140-20130426/3466_1 /TAXON_ID=298111 /ORGANISM="Pavlova sp., Strain CCMP459" /LENGTH=193 /DNA_ID=CAMNT_0027751865 /DNA_START=19 /DNA_END=600 /DNA_ORIENTATION=-
MSAVILLASAITGVIVAPQRIVPAQCHHGIGRRGAVVSAFAAVASAGVSLPAFAVQDPTDITRLQKGYKNIDYLLTHWEQETTTNEGARDADAVRKALGLRSTEDPLFQLEKVLQKAVQKTDPDRIEEWIDASDSLNTHVSNANEFAYTSAFGEYNPGGGKDQIDKYLELSRKELEGAAKDLKKICELLNLEV